MAVLIPVADAYNGFHFLGAVFAGLCAMMFALTKLKPRSEAWVHVHSGDVELTPWRWAKPAAAALIIIVLAIYASFADFSVLKAKPAPAVPAAASPVAPQ